MDVTTWNVAPLPPLGDFIYETFNGTLYTAGDGGAGGVANSSFTITGVGGDALTSFLQGLQLHLNAPPGSYVGQVGLTFTLNDTTANASNNWTEFFLACFASGTRIATPSGAVAVETLRVGGRVMTASGVAQSVRWVGHRRYTAAQVAANRQLRPVLIRRDALGTGLPHRDLLVSALHGMLIDGALVPAVALVNGVSVLRRDDLVPVSYVHIELTGHGDRHRRDHRPPGDRRRRPADAGGGRAGRLTVSSEI